MIIADLTNADTGQRLGRVYLAEAPFPGDIIRQFSDPEPDVMVIRRTFLDLGPDTDSAHRLSLELTVRPV
jgi:hypothetical protein